MAGLGRGFTGDSALEASIREVYGSLNSYQEVFYTIANSDPVVAVQTFSTQMDLYPDEVGIRYLEKNGGFEVPLGIKEESGKRKASALPTRGFLCSSLPENVRNAEELRRVFRFLYNSAPSASSEDVNNDNREQSHISSNNPTIESVIARYSIPPEENSNHPLYCLRALVRHFGLPPNVESDSKKWKILTELGLLEVVTSAGPSTLVFSKEEWRKVLRAVYKAPEISEKEFNEAFNECYDTLSVEGALDVCAEKFGLPTPVGLGQLEQQGVFISPELRSAINRAFPLTAGGDAAAVGAGSGASLLYNSSKRYKLPLLDSGTLNCPSVPSLRREERLRSAGLSEVVRSARGTNDRVPSAWGVALSGVRPLDGTIGSFRSPYVYGALHDGKRPSALSEADKAAIERGVLRAGYKIDPLPRYDSLSSRISSDTKLEKYNSESIVPFMGPIPTLPQSTTAFAAVASAGADGAAASSSANMAATPPIGGAGGPVRSGSAFPPSGGSGSLQSIAEGDGDDPAPP